MKPATAALIDYFNTHNDVVVCDLYTFAFADGNGLRYVDYSIPLTIPSANFPGSQYNYNPSGSRSFQKGPKFGRSKVTTKIGLEPAELDIEVFPDPITDLIGALTWQSFANAGGFDGATIELDRFFMPVGADGLIGPIDTSLGAIVWFLGRIADTDISRTTLKIKVKSMVNLLQQQQMPRRLFQAGCTHVFGDTMCGYDRANGLNALGTPTGFGAQTITLGSGSSQIVLIATTTVPAIFALGTAVGTGGANTGSSRGIIAANGSTTVSLFRPFVKPVSPGDAFQLLPGCDHNLSTCNGTFQNILRYGGFDYIPPPELSV